MNAIKEFLKPNRWKVLLLFPILIIGFNLYFYVGNMFCSSPTAKTDYIHPITGFSIEKESFVEHMKELGWKERHKDDLERTFFSFLLLQDTRAVLEPVTNDKDKIILMRLWLSPAVPFEYKLHVNQIRNQINEASQLNLPSLNLYIDRYCD